MNRPVCLAGIGLFGASLSYLSASSAAEDGSIRDRINQRRIERRAGEAQPGTNAKITKGGHYTFSLDHDGSMRQYRVYVPMSYDPAKSTPLLFALHGGGGNMDYQAEDANYGLIGKSDAEGYIVVFPNGYSRLRGGKLATWNAGDCCGAARDGEVDDVGFIRRIAVNVTRQMNVDRSRIYATGMSNGAMMAYRLACEMSDVFKAVAAVAGTDNTRECRPKHPISVLHIHAKDDTHVLYEGGAGPDARKDAVTDFESVPDTLTKWVRLNSCVSTPRRVLENEGAYCELYSQCRDDSKVQLCVTESGGHSWPGAQKSRRKSPSQAISANDVMWDFFESDAPATSSAPYRAN